MASEAHAAVSAHDVARSLEARLPQAGAVKLHKLLYYCQGWTLAWADEPMFRETIEAWTNGPVVADYWRDVKHGREIPRPTPLTTAHESIVDAVVDAYGRMTARQLIRQTHNEAPWTSATEGDPDTWFFTSPNPEITHAALRRWFSQSPTFIQRSELLERWRRIGLYSVKPVPDLELDELVAQTLAGHPVRESRPA